MNEIGNIISYLDHNFICYWVNYYECIKCKCIIKLKNKQFIQYLTLNNKLLFEGELKLTCNEIIIKNIIE